MKKLNLSIFVILWLVLGLTVTTMAGSTFPRGYVGKLNIEPTEGPVNSRTTLHGRGFAPNTTLTLVWNTYEGGWNLEHDVAGEYTGNYLGRQFGRASIVLDRVTVDADGSFSTVVEIPEDYGGTHDIYIRDANDNLNKVGFFIRPQATVTPDHGPLGTDIKVTYTGLNAVHPMEGWYLLTYDNRITGYMTAVTTRGTARLTIPATGRPGKHLIELKKGSFGAPYLALGTSPLSYLPVPRFTFTITEGEPVLPAPIESQKPAAVAAAEPNTSAPVIWIDPTQAPVGTAAAIRGKGLPPNTRVRLDLSAMVGSRVTASGFAPVANSIGEVETDDQGRFQLPYTYPDAHGGSHRVTAFVGDRELARTHLTVERIGLPLEPASGPVGTNIVLHIKGVGWTQTENIFGIVVDNTYIGYACGFSTNGDVRVPISASWEPGWHFIDLYPSFYRNKDYAGAEEQPFLYRHAILTWPDHPSGFHFRYAFKVTE